MALSHSPKISLNGLVLCLDAANSKSYDSRENLVSYSNYNVSTWSNIFPAGATITTGIDAPDGTSSAVRFSCNNTTNALLRVSFPSFTPNGTDTYTTSFYVRRVSGSGNAFTDFADGAPSVNYSSQLITGQWVRVVTSAVPTATAKSFIDLYSDQNTNLVLDFWGVQIEKNTTATTYTPTNGSTITRPTTWTDLSGNNYDFTIYGSPTYNSSGYFTFANNQTTQYIMRYPFETPTTDITYSCWFRSNFTNPNQTPFTYSVSGNNEMLLFTNSSTQLAPHPKGVSVAVNTTSMTNVWVNFVWTRVTSSGQSLFYRDGQNIGQYTASAGTSITSGGHMIIGQEADSDGGGFDPNQNLDGDFVRLDIYNRALTPQEIQQNYNALKGRFQ